MGALLSHGGALIRNELGEVTTFYVDIHIDHKAISRVISRPFGRLDIDAGSITVRAWPAWLMRQQRSTLKGDIDQVEIRRSYYVNVLVIHDVNSAFAGIRVLHPVGADVRLRRELDRCGYVVVVAKSVGPIKGMISRRRK